MSGKGGVKKLPLLLAGLLLAGYMAYLFAGEWLSLQTLNVEKAALQTRQEEMDKKTDALKQVIAFSKTDSFIERMARELLGWVKPGEIKIAEKDK